MIKNIIYCVSYKYINKYFKTFNQKLKFILLFIYNIANK